MSEKKIATIKDVARLANTSTATVSYVLNEVPSRYVSADLRKRVLDAAAELHYIRSTMASGLKGKKRGIIAALVPQFTNIFFNRFLLGVEQVAHRNNYIISVCNTFDDSVYEKQVLYNAIGHHVDGFILVPTEGSYSNYEIVRNFQVPYVVAERPLHQSHNYDFVAMDNYDAGYTATKHLINCGHRRIGLMTWRTNVTTLQGRPEGYYAALKEAGLEISPNLLYAGDFSEEAGARLTRQMLKDNPDITAIVYDYHVQALGGYKALKECGVRIPEDISVVIVGDPEWEFIADPPLTCIQLPAFQVGQRSAELLFDKILATGQDTPHTPVSETIKGTLLQGKSVKTLL
ncbi:MAG: LacI family DNA-binding transcriptional regulator [Oscillospiraceae bacterium]|nr:LacI family DNA-binding transcriptional regulator [Oscillospiraceae bacterium]